MEVAEPTETVVEAQTDVTEEVVSQEETTQEEQQPEVKEEQQETVEEKLERLEKARERDQKKINRQTASNHGHLKKIEELNAKLQELETKAPSEQVSKEPDINDFESFDDYQEAVVEYRVEQKTKETQAKSKEQEQLRIHNEKMQERRKAIETNEAEYSKANPAYKNARQEFVEFTSTAKLNPNVENAMIDVAMREGNFAEVINYFGENGGDKLDEFMEIAKLTPVEAGIKIYDICKQLKGKPAPEKKKPIPKPASKVSGKGRAVNDLDNLKPDDDVLVKLGLKK